MMRGHVHNETRSLFEKRRRDFGGRDHRKSHRGVLSHCSRGAFGRIRHGTLSNDLSALLLFADVLVGGDPVGVFQNCCKRNGARTARAFDLKDHAFTVCGGRAGRRDAHVSVRPRHVCHAGRSKPARLLFRACAFGVFRGDHRRAARLFSRRQRHGADCAFRSGRAARESVARIVFRKPFCGQRPRRRVRARGSHGFRSRCARVFARASA